MSDCEEIEGTLEGANALAESWRLQGRWADALTLLNGSWPIALQKGNGAVAGAWLLIARVLIDQAIFGGFDTWVEREEALRQALLHAEAHGEPDLIAAVWDAKGFSLHAAYLEHKERQEPKHELEFFEHSLLLRRQANSSKEIAESLFHIGLFHGVVRNDHARALPYLEDAYRLAQSAEDRVVASYAIRHIAFARHAAGDLAGAHAGLEESLRLREEAQFEPGVAMALMALASLNGELGRKDEAALQLTRARGILEMLGAAPRVALVDQELAALAPGRN